MSALDFLNADAGELATHALIRKLRDAGNVFLADVFTGDAATLHALLGCPENGFTPRQKELFAKSVPDPAALSTILEICREECQRARLKMGDAPFVYLHRTARERLWEIHAPPPQAKRERHVLRLVFCSAVELARFEGYLAARMGREFIDPFEGIQKVTTQREES